MLKEYIYYCIQCDIPVKISRRADWVRCFDCKKLNKQVYARNRVKVIKFTHILLTDDTLEKDKEKC